MNNERENFPWDDVINKVAPPKTYIQTWLDDVDEQTHFQTTITLSPGADWEISMYGLAWRHYAFGEALTSAP